MTTLNKHCGSNVSPAQLAGLLRGACTTAELQQVALYVQDQREGAIEINDHPSIDMEELIDHVQGSPSASPPQAAAKMQSVPDSDYADLRRELQRLRREKEDDEEFLNTKIRQLKRQCTQAIQDKEEQEAYARELEQQKCRLEKLLKQQTLSKGTSQDDLLQDVTFVQRRLEMLEQSAEQRA